jgi:hypothetical protein
MKMIPKFKNEKDEEDYHLAMLELSVKIDDTHSDLITKTTNNSLDLNGFLQILKLLIKK